MAIEASELYANASPTVRRSMEEQGIVVSKKTDTLSTVEPNRRPGRQIARASCTLESTEDRDPRNKTEQRYEAEVLVPAQIRGEVVRWWFEPVKLRLAKATYYAPDYLVVMASGRMVFHEVKGRPGAGPGGWMDDARVKIKTAAEMFGDLWGFIGASKLPKKDGGGWKTEVFA